MAQLFSLWFKKSACTDFRGYIRFAGYPSHRQPVRLHKFKLAPVIPAGIADFMDVKHQGVERAAPFMRRDAPQGLGDEAQKHVRRVHAAQCGVKMEDGEQGPVAPAHRSWLV